MLIYIQLLMLFACGDSESDSKTVEEEEKEEQKQDQEDCTDEIDNDNDGLIDCDDSDCLTTSECDDLEPAVEPEPASEPDDPDTSVPDTGVEEPNEEDPEPYSLDLGNGNSASFVLIQSGTFMMGSPIDEVGRYTEETYGIDEDQYEVTLTNNFYVMTTEVTQGMFEELMGFDSREGESSTSSQFT